MSPAQRRADSIGLVAECALASAMIPLAAAPTENGAETNGAKSGAARNGAAKNGAQENGAQENGAGNSGGAEATRRARARTVGRADRFQVVVHIDAAALAKDSDAGQAVLATGVRVSAETSRRLACDSGRVTMVHDARGNLLDVGRRTRTVPSAIRRALDQRDRGCRFPGCGLRFCDAHHIVHWADGGGTRLDNLLLLCRFHHRLVHEGGCRVELTSAGEVRFLRPDGRLLPGVPAPVRLSADAVGTLSSTQRAEGIEIDHWTATPHWHGDPLDVDWAVLTMRRRTPPDAAAVG